MQSERVQRDAEVRGDDDPEGFELVIVELDWYDGLRAGIANLGGAAHYFRTEDCTHPPDEVTFLTWPVDDATLRLEIEAWAIFVEWNDRYEAGEATAASHPGAGGTNSRYDELTGLLEEHRVPPATAVPRRAQWRHLHRSKRYELSGPGDEVCWKVIGHGAS